jgi:hypothetical protein
LAVSVYARAVRRAAELLGGRDNLAAALQVPRAEIDKWLAEEKKPPRDMFLRVVDLIIDDGRPAGGESGAQEPPAPRESAPGSAAFLD